MGSKLRKSKKGQGMDAPSSLGSWVWFAIILVILVFLLYIFGAKIRTGAERIISIILGR
jgi:hypothetical protein